MFKKGNTPWNKGTKPSEDTVKKMIESRKWYRHSEETKLKIVEARKGFKHSEETKLMMSESRKGKNLGDKNSSWKGDAVGNTALHHWVRKQLGKPSNCEHCGLNDKKRMYHWANKSRMYRRDLSDWLRLCVPCHKRYDLGKIELIG